MIFSCLSDVGRVRKNNEDYCKGEVININEEAVGIFALADGMGGHNKGEVASEMAVENIIECIKSSILNSSSIKIDYIDDIIKQAYNNVNSIIYNKSNEDDSYFGMGTTLVVAIIYKDDIWIANVGDSRVYIMKEDKIKQVTIDHSIVEEFVRAKIITEEEAKTHPRRNQITRAIGTDPIVIVDIFKEKFGENNKLLLCSDGLSGFVDDDKILDILKSDEDINVLSQRLINTANKSCGKDNITVILIQNN